ncbi:MAG: PLP-dependent cysteine synthase family protein [Candidatus Kariarchaeaceae archaeon]|jgi:cysteine synthase B
MIESFGTTPILPEGFASQGIISNIGDTPLIPITNLVPRKSNVRIFAKAEFMNPGGSVKDRPAWNMIKEGILQNSLTYDKTILDATSGNTGIAYALIGSALGFRVKLCVPKNASPERVHLMRAYGAELVLTDPLEGTDGAIVEASSLYDQNPEAYFYVDQYNNPANWQAHYDTTALEILNQTANEITHFVAGLGTSGTFIGIAKRLSEEKIPKVKCISFQPDNPFHGLEGLKHMETAIVPGIYDKTVADKTLTVNTSESYEMTKELARKEGLLVGVSSGAALLASLAVAETIETGIIVTIFPDRGERYLSDKFWSQ